MNPATSEEPKPNGDGRDIATLVKQDIESRAQSGEERYGERLTPNNGRNALNDAYQEALDLCMYLRQKIEESKQQTKQKTKPMSENEEQEPKPSVREALYQHGQKISKHARHKVQSPVVNDEEYMPRDVMAAMYYMNQNTIADVASRVADSDLSGKASSKITKILDDIRNQFKSLDEPNE